MDQMKFRARALQSVGFFLIAILSLHACGRGGHGHRGGAAPAAPTGVVVTAFSGGVTVDWEAVAGATSYNVYMAAGTGVTKTNYETLPLGDRNSVAAGPFTHTELADGTTYYFVVTALNAAGESPESEEVSAMPVSTALPPAPTGLRAISSAGRVTLEWNSVTGASSYFVYRATVSGIDRNNWNTIVGGSRTQVFGGATVFIASGLTDGTTYYFVVTAQNSLGQSVESAEVSATPFASETVPTPPTNFVATPGDQKVTLSWNNSTGATSYRIYWRDTRPPEGITPSNGQQIPNVSSPSVHTGLTNGAIYYYIVVAVNDRGESLPSSEISVIPNPTPPPGVITLPPTNLTLAGSAELNGRINPNGFPVTEAYFEYGVTTGYGTTVQIPIQNFGGGNNFIDINPITLNQLDPAKPYHYRLVAKNANGAAVGADQGFVLPFFGPPDEYPVGGNSPNDVIVADLNGDGELDLATANFGTNDISILFGTGDFSGPQKAFSSAVHYSVGSHPQYLAIGYFHGGGKPPDLVVSNETDGTVTLLSNDGTGVFSPTSIPVYSNLADQTKTFPAGVVVADFNKDLNPDLAVAATVNGNGKAIILSGDGAGGFAAPSEFSAGISPTRIVAGDFDHDGTGNLDLVVTNRLTNKVSLLLGNGDGSFNAPSPFNVGDDPNRTYDPIALASGDFNNDNFLDLAVADNASSTVSVLLNSASGGFGAPTLLIVGLQPYSIGLKDFSGDGKPDLIVPNFRDNSVSVYLGTGSDLFGPASLGLTGRNPVASATEDFNADGKPDLVIVNRSANSLSLLIGQ